MRWVPEGDAVDTDNGISFSQREKEVLPSVWMDLEYINAKWRKSDIVCSGIQNAKFIKGRIGRQGLGEGTVRRGILVKGCKHPGGPALWLEFNDYGLPWWLNEKEPIANAGDAIWSSIRKVPWRRNDKLTSSILVWDPYVTGALEGYCLWGRKESGIRLSD